MSFNLFYTTFFKNMLLQINNIEIDKNILQNSFKII